MDFDAQLHLFDPETEREALRAQRDEYEAWRARQCRHEGDKYRRNDSWIGELGPDAKDLVEGWVCSRCGNRAIRMRRNQPWNQSPKRS